MSALISWFLIFQFLTFLPVLAVHASPDTENTPGGHPSVPAVKVQAGTLTPFTINPLSHFLIIPVQINGQKPLPFIVDTGVNQPVIIEKWAAERLKLVSTGETITISPGNQNLPLTSLRSLLIRGTTPATDSEYTSVPASIDDVGLPNYGAPRIAGVLGMPLFFKFVMQLDFSRHTMYLCLPEQIDRTQLEPNASYLTLVQPDEAEARYSVAWPARSSKSVTTSTDSGGYEHTVTSTSTDTYNLGLDTGANSSCLPETIISSLHPVGMTAAQIITAGGLSSDGTLAFIPNLGFAGSIVPNLFVRQSDSKSEITAANTLGIDILCHFRVTFDFPNKLLILDKFNKDSTTRIPGTTGIRLEKRGECFFVHHISNHSPAEKTSIRVGDQISQIDDQILLGYSEQVAQKILDGDAGMSAELLIHSSLKKKTCIAVQRINRFDGSLYPHYGFQTVQRVLNNAIVVSNILCSSVAWAAGLRAGDEVSQINGIAMKSLSQGENQLRGWPKTKVTLTVQRQGQQLTIQLKALPSAENTGLYIRQQTLTPTH